MIPVSGISSAYGNIKAFTSFTGIHSLLNIALPAFLPSSPRCRPLGKYGKIQNEINSVLRFSTFSADNTKSKILQHRNVHKVKTSSTQAVNIYPKILGRRLFFSGYDDENEDTEIDLDGSIIISNEQETHSTLSESIPLINRSIDHIRDILGYPNYGVDLRLVDDPAIQELNYEFLGKNRPTDILSFPFDDDVIVEPGVLRKPDFDIPEMYTLGDMMISVPYVMRRAEEDMKYLEDRNKSENFDEFEEDRGISGIMSTIPTVEERIPALLVHGMLHLVGYDHIEDDDYELMVKKEEEVWEELKRRIEDDKKRI